MNIIFLPLFLVGFLLAIFLAFYVPGVLLLRQEKISPFAKIVTATIIGMVLWAWQGYVFGYLHIRWASYIYLFVYLVLFFKNTSFSTISLKHISWKKIDFISVGLILLGTFVQTLPYVRAGFITSSGLLTVAYNQTDHYYHSSMIHEIVQRFPPFEPGMYGILKLNYHYWFNLTTAELVRVFHLPLFQTQFLGMYVFGSLFLGLTLLVLAYSLRVSKILAYLLLLFFYFGGDASYWVTFVMPRKFDFGVPSIIEDGAFFMDNPPRAFSIIIALTAIYLLFLYLNKKLSNKYVLPILFGTLIGFKVYTGIAFLAGFGMLALYLLLVSREKKTFLLFICSLVLSAIVFLPVNASSGGLFFLPFDKVRDFITYKPLGFYDWELRWGVYYEHHNILRLLQLGLMMTGVYLLSQFGVKMVGGIPYKKTLQVLGKEKVVFCYSIICFSLLLGMFFSQKANFAESYNFFLPASIILSILTSLHLSLFLRNKSVQVSIIILFLLVGCIIPRWVYRVNFTLSKVFTFSGISHEELASYDFLRSATPQDSLLLILNKEHEDEHAAIVGVLADRRVYLSGQSVIQAHNTTNKRRQDAVNQIYENPNPKVVATILRKNHIRYVYFYSSTHITAPISQLPLKTVYKSPSAIIMEVTAG